ncbi:hypothetical protein J6590_097087 [Homalodisca vitripennis]|nr:hypothetical protein J6590_097087 [Homalodisca vitripennis]
MSPPQRLSEDRIKSVMEIDQGRNDKESTERPLEPTRAEEKADTEVPVPTPTSLETRCQKRPLVLLERADLEEAKRTRLEQALVPKPDPLKATRSNSDMMALRPEAESLTLAASGKTSKKGPPRSKGETTSEPGTVTSKRDEGSSRRNAKTSKDPVTSIGDEGTQLPATSKKDEGGWTTKIPKRTEEQLSLFFNTAGIPERDPVQITGCVDPKRTK